MTPQEEMRAEIDAVEQTVRELGNELRSLPHGCTDHLNGARVEFRERP